MDYVETDAVPFQSPRKNADMLLAHSTIPGNHFKIFTFVTILHILYFEKVHKLFPNSIINKIIPHI